MTARAARFAAEPTISHQFVTTLFDRITDRRDLVDEALQRFELEAGGRAADKVSLKRYIELFEWLAESLRRPYLGLELSQRGGAEVIGAVGYLFMGSRNLGAAIRNMSHYLGALQEHSTLQFGVEDEYAFVDYATARGALVVLDPHNYRRYYGERVGDVVPMAACTAASLPSAVSTEKAPVPDTSWTAPPNMARQRTFRPSKRAGLSNSAQPEVAGDAMASRWRPRGGPHR